MGHVFLNAEIVAATREGKLEQAVDIFMSYNGKKFPYKLLNKALALELENYARAGILSEMKDLKPADMGRVSHLFLMVNNQRRHLFEHFENLDIARIEFELPFFDAEFLSAILREKIDPFLRHRFYLDWLQSFPLGVAETPWQAYPKHMPCPLPLPQGLAYQWDEATKKSKQASSSVALAQARLLIKNQKFASKFLSSGHMRMFIALLWLRHNEHDYLLHAPEQLLRYWASSDGAAKVQVMELQQKMH